MFIKRLEIFGFKSFKNKTVLEFNNYEISGIVGPNGCGKSNVVDALLWVMGENSPKHLRGETSSDIIFGGTQKESPGNLAEVSLLLDRGRSEFPENYKKFSELMISRRAYRDGKSEYFINEQPCLLRDIREFFMNTGAGCRGFSIIEQEAIERLIVAKPIQRRFIIEEVAGITKFKNRKNESLRKLDLVNQNLQRLNDVLKLQESQLSQLTSQAKKAEKYKKLKQDIEDKQKQIDRREQEDLFCAYQNFKKEQESLKVKKEEKEKEGQNLKKQIQVEKSKLETIKKEQQEKQKVQMEKQKAQVEKQMEQQMKVEVFNLVENIENKKTALKEKEDFIQRDLQPVYDFFKNTSDIDTLEKEIRQIQNNLDEIKQDKRDAEIKLNVLQKRTQFIEEEMGVLSDEKNNFQLQIQKSINSKNKFISLLNKNQQMNLKFDQEIDLLSKNEEILENKRESVTAELNSLSQTVQVLHHKVEEMKKLFFQFESVNEGSKSLKQWRPEGFQSLFHSLKADSDYSTALGVVLGHHAQALIPKEDLFGIEQAVQWLKSHNKGKASFLSSLPGLSVADSSKEEIRTYPAFDCFLDEKVQWNLHIEPLRSLLEQTAVVSDLNSAFELKKQFSSFQFVTKEGDLITKDSIIYAGSSNRETSLFKIQDQINEYTKELSAKKIEIQVKTVDLESCKEKLNQVRKEKQSVQNKTSQGSEGLIYLRKDVEQVEKDILRLSEERKKSDQRITVFEEEKSNLIQHEKAYIKEIQDLEEAISSKEDRSHVLQTAVDEHKKQNLKKIKGERELLENRKDQKKLNQEVSVLLNLIGESQNSEKLNDSAINKEGDKTLSMQEIIQLVSEQKKELDAHILNAQKELEEQNQIKEKQEKYIEEMEKQIFQMQLDVNNLDSEWGKKELEKNHLAEKFLEDYQLQIEQFVSSSEDIPLDKLKEEIIYCEKQLDKIKEINFLALEEYEKLSKENFFLNEQKEDLVNSKKEIMKVISHIDKFCAVRFNDMLEEINKKFSMVFPVVFQGDNAKAELILREDPDGGDSGVDILIHPPGKRPQSVNLLSRGEKALTSICLIYSLFLVKPSPFCIIDEADAPLDDANIFRFLSVVKEMSRKSQIIAITHNKYTMQVCKKLYGVTMERPGISQIVSVDMESAHQTVSQTP